MNQELNSLCELSFVVEGFRTVSVPSAPVEIFQNAQGGPSDQTSSQDANSVLALFVFWAVFRGSIFFF